MNFDFDTSIDSALFELEPIELSDTAIDLSFDSLDLDFSGLQTGGLSVSGPGLSAGGSLFASASGSGFSSVSGSLTAAVGNGSASASVEVDATGESSFVTASVFAGDSVDSFSFGTLDPVANVELLGGFELSAWDLL